MKFEKFISPRGSSYCYKLPGVSIYNNANIVFNTAAREFYKLDGKWVCFYFDDIERVVGMEITEVPTNGSHKITKVRNSCVSVSSKAFVHKIGVPKLRSTELFVDEETGFICFNIPEQC